jgi:transposase, IS6 family
MNEPAPLPPCPRCSCAAVKKDGRPASTTQRYRCRGCRRTFTAHTGTPFTGHRWPLEVITAAVRWYFRYRLSAADVRDLLAERSIGVSARTVLARAHKFGPLLAAEGRRQARPVGTRWWCDETYVRVKGRWAYLYRAVDEAGQVVDVLLRERRDLASARAFFEQAIARRGRRPRVVITDKHPACRRAVRRRFWRATHIRTGLHRARGETTKAIERAHVPIKDRLRPMRGLQSVATGQRLVEGLELVRAVRCGHIGAAPWPHGAGAPQRRRSPHERAREVVATFARLATRLTQAA